MGLKLSVESFPSIKPEVGCHVVLAFPEMVWSPLVPLCCLQVIHTLALMLFLTIPSLLFHVAGGRYRYHALVSHYFNKCPKENKNTVLSWKCNLFVGLGPCRPFSPLLRPSWQCVLLGSHNFDDDVMVYWSAMLCTHTQNLCKRRTAC